MIKRLLLSAVSLALLLLVAEGALSLLAGRSLLELLGGRGVEAPARFASRPAAPPLQDQKTSEPAPAAPAEPGSSAEPESIGRIYAAHDDPLVSYVLKPDAELQIFDGLIHSDHLGLRRRPGPEAPEGALRVVVLGDSIAFGFGVDDEQALAARLERRLAQLRGDRERPIVCRTVAIPSWNHRAAFAFMVDHWDELRPDLVLYLPVRNDVFDMDGTYADGSRRVQPDPASADPWLTVSVHYMLYSWGQRLLKEKGGTLTQDELGTEAPFSDLCAESQRRHDENARGIAALDHWLAERGCRLALVWFVQDDYTWFISSRLQSLAPDLPMIPLLKWSPPEFSLGNDPHPNPRTLDVWACWLAQELVDRDWVSRGSGDELPPAPEPYAKLRAQMPSPGDWARLADEARGRWRQRLRPEIDLESGRGLLQVFGGLNPDYSVRSQLLAILDPQGPALELSLAPLAERRDLYPLEVSVEANGIPVGSVTIPPDGPAQARLPLPAGLNRTQPLEVRLSPAHWVVLGPPGGVARLGNRTVASFRLLRLACLP